MDTDNLSPGIWGVVAVVLVGTIFSSFDGKFYWHDVRFLYAAAQFTLPEVFAGAFNPHQAWNEANEVSASGFYIAKMLHIWLVQSILESRAPAEGGIDLVVSVFSVMMLMSVIISGLLFMRIFRVRSKAVIASICLCLLPIIPYLTGKLLSETSSLLFLTASILILAVSFNRSLLQSLLLATIAGLFLGVAMLCRLDSIVGAIGFVIASAMISLFIEDRVKVLQLSLVMVFIAVSVVFYAYHLVGFDLDAIFLYFHAFTSAGQKSLAMTPLGIISFGGVMFLPALIAVYSERSKVFWFFLIWFMLTFLPMAMLTSLYMVEPRYLIQAAVPLAGLSTLGVVKIMACGNSRKGMLRLIVLAIVTVSLNQIVIRTMPYELDRHAMHQAIDTIFTGDPDAVLAIPWSYTDFNYLKMVLPDDRIYNVNSPIGTVSESELYDYWNTRFSGWYQGRHLKNLTELERVLSKKNVYYLAWHSYPPIQVLRDQAASWGLTGIANRLDELGMLDHRTTSWMWDNQLIGFQLEGNTGQYEYYRVTRKGV